MSFLLFTKKDVIENFAPSFLEQGKEYQQEGLVQDLKLSEDSKKLHAKVLGTEKQPYHVEINITHDEDGLWIDGTCTCQLGFNCEHVTATLWEALSRTETPANAAADALPEFTIVAAPAKPVPISDEAERIIYILSEHSSKPHTILQVEPGLVRPLKSGYFSKPKTIAQVTDLAKYLQPVDEHLLKWLDFVRKQEGQGALGPLYTLTGANGSALMQQLVSTGRCYWVTPNSPPLHMGEPRQAKLEWQLENNGLQRLRCIIPGESSALFLLNPLWYIDYQRHQCGLVMTSIEPALVITLLHAPALKPEQIQQLQLSLAKRTPISPSSVAATTIKSEKTLQVAPVPQLKLMLGTVKISPTYLTSSQEFEMQLPVAELSFLYDSAQVFFGDQATYVDGNKSDQLVHYQRDFTKEAQLVAKLKQIELMPLAEVSQYRITRQYPHYWAIHPEFEQRQIVQFSLARVPELRREGWLVIIDENYPYIVIEEEEADWYSAIEEQANNAWFDLELGITLHGERINLLPLIVEMIEQYFTDLSFAAIQAIPAETKLLARLPDGRYLPVPIERIRTILHVLTELYDHESLGGSQKLRLSKLRAAQLAELEAAVGAAKFRWFGGEQIRELGEKLRHFEGIKDVAIPEGFQAELRPYQQEGLNWLQFLCEFNLAGVLADDMGLGKTVQTLAHILVERRSGRMQCPCLVIAPTSLMVNWFMEAKRFAPELEVLILHGAHRKPLFEQIERYDLILTTYPLLVRDKEILLSLEYHLVILDEAQVIKNPRAKSAQIVQQIKAKHRLCLTGTPMENHLGELWSIFHFLMPGLLGEQEQFKKLFRNPIEKMGDNERRKVLAKRISPFLLRRTKTEVVHELPPKTEITKAVELESGQRDLYESIRVALHQKISQVIQNKGFANSQIVILDALLKLRQTCCDPRLLKLPAASKFNAGSAKLELLMDILPNLIEEGRRVLLFSQFTEMLALIEQELLKANLAYVKLTGKTKDRAQVIEQFQSCKVPLFLISLKAGGTGLNLTAADTVIHYDPWWNPAVEHQATDRAYRIGQDKPVFVYKLITAGTVEEKILSLQAKKQSLMEDLFAEQGLSKSLINPQDLTELFQPFQE